MPPDPTYLGYRAASIFANLLPEAAVSPVSEVAGRIAPHLFRGRADMVQRHQRRVRPDLDPAASDAAVRETFSSYVRYWLESFRLPGTTAEVLEARFEVEGYEHVQAGLDAGKGVILALPHLGSWEWAGFWLTAVKGEKVSAVAEVLDPPELAEWFISLRARYGLDIIPLDGSAGTRVTRALADNRIVCLLCDRDITGSGVEVEFFGERTTLPAGPATLALRSGAPLLPAVVYFDGTNHRVMAKPQIPTERHGRLRDDVARITQELAGALEGLIELAPEQWHLLQPNWPTDRERR